MAKNKGSLKRCPKCGNFEVLTKHHYLPQRYYGNNPFYIRLCRKCHEAVEKLIPENQKLPAVDYFEIAYCFIFRQTYIRR